MLTGSQCPGKRPPPPGSRVCLAFGAAGRSPAPEAPVLRLSASSSAELLVRIGRRPVGISDRERYRGEEGSLSSRCSAGLHSSVCEL